MSYLISFFGFRFRVTPELREHVIFSIWIIATFKQFRYDELLLYPLALYYLVMFVKNFSDLFDLFIRSIILWAFPFWWFLSAMWGAETGTILRSGLQLVLTLVICIYVADRVSPRRIIMSVLIAAAFFAVLSLNSISQGGIAARGVFASKNVFGGAMVILWVAALCVFIDTTYSKYTRLGAALLGILALYLIQVSSSATAILLAVGATGVLLAVLAYERVPPLVLTTSLMMIAALIATLGAGIAFAVPVFDPVAQVLDAFGKDATLTGRTVLWNYAMAEIAERPLLGLGQGGFWDPRDGLSTSARIYAEFYKASYANFSFHSSYYEIAVHQGLIGVALVVLATAWCVMRVLVYTIFVGGTQFVFFVCMTMIMLARSLTEIGLMMPFVQLSMLMIIGALITLKRSEFPIQPSVSEARLPPPTQLAGNIS